MADRRVTVTLDANIARYKAQMAEAAAATQAFGRSTGGAGKDIDKFSGRLRVLADAAITLGPALIPIGASAIPVLTAALAGLGAAAGGIGVTVLAMQGLGDGLKALDAYQLQPTAENLAKVRQEMEKLGPSGAHFVHFLDDLEPQLSDLQNIARAGLFPGVEDGITDLLTRLPQVKRIVADLSDGMGDLAREGGEALASDKFTAFFNYIETDARPTLEAFAHSAGNVAEGVANLIVAFAPLSRDFTGGLEDATKAFAKWSEGLDQNASFQEFLSYVRESGPQVIEFLGAIGSAIAGLVKAAAPMGQVVLPALTALARVFAAIANTPIGPPLYTAAAGLVAFNRAAAISGRLSDNLAASFANLGLEAETTKGKLTNIGLAGGAAALALGTVSDAQEILAARSRSNDTLDATVKSLQDLEDTVAGSNLQKYAEDLHIDIPRLTDDLAKNGSQGEYVQQVLKDLEGSSHGFGAAANALAGNILPFYTASADKAYDANKDLNTIIGELGNGLGKAPGLFGGIIDVLGRATDAAHDLSGALAELNGWFDRRQAVRDYRDSIHELSKSLKDGFGRKDVENLDAVGRNILQVANGIKDPALQRDFLQGARASLVDLADNAGPKAAGAIQRLIDKFDDEHLTHPPKPKLDVDDHAARQKLDGVNGMMRVLDRFIAKPKVDAETGQATSAINQVTTMLRNLNGTTATTYVRTVRNDIPLPGRSADGGSVPKDGGPYSDRFMYLLAPGEEVISNRHGEADRYRARIKGRYADGGTTGGHFTLSANASQGGVGDQMFTSGAYSVAKALKALQAALARSEKALDKERQSRDDLQSQYDSIKSTVGSAYSSMDPFAASTSVWSQSNPLGMFDSALASNTANTQAAQTALAFAQSHGLDGPLYAALAASGNLPLLQAFANLSSAEIDQREKAFAAQSNAQAALGGMAANAQVGAQLADANHHLNKLRDEVRELRRDVRQADQNNQKAQDKNAKDVKDGVNGAAAHGHKRGRH